MMAAAQLMLLVSVTAVVAALRCSDDWQCGVGGACDTLLSCCRVRGCAGGCPTGYTCVAIGYPRCGKFSKLTDTCACPRKHGCVPLRAVLSELAFRQKPQPSARQLPWLGEEQKSRRQPSQVASPQLSESVSRILSHEGQLFRQPYQLHQLPPPAETAGEHQQRSGTEEAETQQQRPNIRPEEEEREWLDVFYDL